MDMVKIEVIEAIEEIVETREIRVIEIMVETATMVVPLLVVMDTELPDTARAAVDTRSCGTWELRGIVGGEVLVW